MMIYLIIIFSSNGLTSKFCDCPTKILKIMYNETIFRVLYLKNVPIKIKINVKQRRNISKELFHHWQDFDLLDLVYK